jgi:hypothetical protein
VLARQPAQELLQHWSGWRILAALAGQSVVEPVQGLALALQSEPDGLRWRVRIDYGT